MLDRRLLTVLVLLAGCRSREAPPSPPDPPAISPAPAASAKLGALPAALRATESSALAAASLGDRAVLFLADADDRAIVTVDATSLAAIARLDIGSPPRDLLVLENGTLLATLPEANAVAVIEPTGPKGELHVARRIPTSTEPLSLAMSRDGKKIAVTAGAGHRVDLLTTDTLVTERTTEVAREPRAAIFAANGTLFVSHATQGALTTLSADGTVAAAIDLDITKGSFDERGTDPPRRARQALGLVRVATTEGEKLFVPLVENAPKNGAPPGGYGGASIFGSWMPMPPSLEFDEDGQRDRTKEQERRREREKARQRAEAAGPLNHMSAFDVRVVDAATAKVVDERERATNRMPALLRECLLPRAAIATSPDRLVVACSGEAQLLELEAKRGYPIVARRLATPRGPAAIARTDGGHFVSWSPIARGIARFDSESSIAVATSELPRTSTIDPKVLAGRELFTRTGDPRISRDGLACASCHPDGRDDGLVWQTPLGDRRPRTLAGNVARTTEFGWGGEQPTIERHVQQTMKRLRGTGLPAEDLDAIFTYLRSLPSVPAADTPRTPDALHGAQVFASERAACATCHDPANGFTDNRAHGMTTIGRVVTPSLLGVGARARIYHDGRYASVEAMIDEQARPDWWGPPMGGLNKLDADERRDLAAYLRTL